jgi:hypothetical protein
MIPGEANANNPPSLVLEVLLPTYSRRELLVETLESMRAQAVPPQGGFLMVE